MTIPLPYPDVQARICEIIDATSDPSYWALKELDIDLHDNQIEIVRAVVDPDCRYLAILQARGAGKTYAVGVGLVRLCAYQSGLSVGVFAPKTDQASRIINEITTKVIPPGSPLYDYVDWSDSTTSRLSFHSGSKILAFSANEQTMAEGWHFNILVVDEAHRVTDTVMTQRLIPMLGSLPNAKTIKIGIPMGRNHFYQSVKSDDKYHVICRDWTECPILLSQGSVFDGGRELSRFVIEQMPLSLKQNLFPDRPDLHQSGSMTELDFNTQYAMRWEEDIDQFLSEEAQAKLVSGTHDILAKAPANTPDKFFFGLDTAGGGLAPGRTDRDYTALAIWRRRSDGVKEKVAAYEWQGDPLTQMAEIQQVIDTRTGRFPCVFGLVDHSNIAIAFVDMLKKQGVHVEGIMFGQTEKTSGKNYKNAMFDELSFELEQGRVKYPAVDKLNQDPCFKKSHGEWCNLQRYRKTGINDTIQAPSDFHDDHTCADVLAVWAMDKGKEFGFMGMAGGQLPNPIGFPGGLSLPSLAAVNATNGRYFGGLSNEPRHFGGPFGVPLH